MVGHRRQAVQDILEVGIRIDSRPTVDSITGPGFSDEQPVPLTQRRGPDRIIDMVVVDLNTSVGGELVHLRLWLVLTAR